MSEWYVKELSQLTGVSVQTLHHYDRIGLLEPSLRLPNGYRVYNQQDLLRLQQIIALKFFGFELSQINTLLASGKDALTHFSAQVESLEAKAQSLLDASAALKQIMAEGVEAKQIPWESIIKVIEVYRMSEQLEHPWVKEIFTPEELKEYAAFESEWRRNSTPQEQLSFEQAWMGLIDNINAHLDHDPQSAKGIEIGKQCMEIVNGIYGTKHAHLRTKKFEQGMVKGKGLEGTGLTTQSVTWLDKAIDAYWHDRLYAILGQVGHQPDDVVYQQWAKVLEDMVGDQEDDKKAIYERALSDSKVSPQAKEWLKGLRAIVEQNQHLQ